MRARDAGTPLLNDHDRTLRLRSKIERRSEPAVDTRPPPRLFHADVRRLGGARALDVNRAPLDLRVEGVLQHAATHDGAEQRVAPPVEQRRPRAEQRRVGLGLRNARLCARVPHARVGGKRGVHWTAARIGVGEHVGEDDGVFDAHVEPLRRVRQRGVRRVAEQADAAMVPHVAVRTRRDWKGREAAACRALSGLADRVVVVERAARDEGAQRVVRARRVSRGRPLVARLVIARLPNRLHPHERATRPAVRRALVAAAAETVRDELAVTEFFEERVRVAQLLMPKRQVRVEDDAIKDSLVLVRVRAERGLEAVAARSRRFAQQPLVRSVDGVGDLRVHAVGADKDIGAHTLARLERRRDALVILRDRHDAARPVDAMLGGERVRKHVDELGAEGTAERLGVAPLHVAKGIRTREQAPRPADQRHVPQRVHDLLDLVTRHADRLQARRAVGLQDEARASR
mmetsp:Transcript_2680/g.8333  ORF Transcript_2680/g.8333 Transcript_2680/m.8333 type:complete len:459 (-) Transcript_2680:132-1508(-)